MIPKHTYNTDVTKKTSKSRCKTLQNKLRASVPQKIALQNFAKLNFTRLFVDLARIKRQTLKWTKSCQQVLMKKITFRCYNTKT